VAVWGASNYTYAEATLSQQLPDWIGSHTRAFQYFGCAPKAVVPDCLKGAVNRACRYEPELNPTYAEMAEHYGICVLPARPVRPRDKAKVEAGVLVAKRWILAVLRHRTFYSLSELNRAIQELLQRLNARALRKLKKTRRELFLAFDQPNALSLPEKPYEYAEWRVATVNIDYHIEVERHYYSVPFRLIREKLDVRLTAHTLGGISATRNSWAYWCRMKRLTEKISDSSGCSKTPSSNSPPPSNGEDIDYRHPRGLNKQSLLELASAQWITNHRNVLLSGPTGVGKSYIACALGNLAARAGYTVLYFRAPRLFETLLQAKGDGTHLKTLTRLAKVQLLILDDLFLSPLTDPERKDLLEIIEDRHGQASTVITSQCPTKEWHHVIGEPTLADAICDRLLHQSYKIELKGESIRKTKK